MYINSLWQIGIKFSPFYFSLIIIICSYKLRALVSVTHHSAIVHDVKFDEHATQEKHGRGLNTTHASLLRWLLNQRLICNATDSSVICCSMKGRIKYIILWNDLASLNSYLFFRNYCVICCFELNNGRWWEWWNEPETWCCSTWKVMNFLGFNSNLQYCINNNDQAFMSRLIASQSTGWKSGFQHFFC